MNQENWEKDKCNFQIDCEKKWRKELRIFRCTKIHFFSFFMFNNYESIVYRYLQCNILHLLLLETIYSIRKYVNSFIQRFKSINFSINFQWNEYKYKSHELKLHCYSNLTRCVHIFLEILHHVIIVTNKFEKKKIMLLFLNGG